jgi:putative phosphoribosyl transferase
MRDARSSGGFTELMPDPHIFKDRAEAGAQLAERLEPFHDQDLLVLGMLPGGMPVAAVIARQLEADLDALVVRTLRARRDPEAALGAITANGSRHLDAVSLRKAAVGDDYLEGITAYAMAEARHLEEHFRGSHPPPRIAGRTVILADDGLACAATMSAAVRAVRAGQPARLTVVLPLADSVMRATLLEADEVVALYEPAPAVAGVFYYHDFRPVQERDVEYLLQANWRRTARNRRRERTPRTER